MSKLIIKTLIVLSLSSLFAACPAARKENFAFDAPVKKIVFEPAFPNDLIYLSTPDAKIVIGKKPVAPAIFEIAGFEIETGKKLWQVPFQGEIVGETEEQILVYNEKLSQLNFVNPANGEITRKIAPAPNPLTSKNSLETGMAFTDKVYLTTKALYTSIYEMAADGENRREDGTFQIGVTAKNWENKQIKWFVPPVKQIVTIENRPVIFGDKVLIVNPPQSLDGNQTFQIVSLETGAEIFRGATDGRFRQFGKDIFIEQTANFVKRFEPLSNAEIWKIEGNFQHASISVVAGQITLSTARADGVRTIFLADAADGKIIRQFDFPNTAETPLRGCFLTREMLVLCNLAANPATDIQKRDFDYWVAYDETTKKILWRTDFNSNYVSSLLPFASGRIRFE